MDILNRYLAKLPDSKNGTWQGGWIRMPHWMKEGDLEPTRAWAMAWTNPQVGYLQASNDVFVPAACTVDRALAELTRFARRAKHAGCNYKRFGDGCSGVSQKDKTETGTE